MRRKVILLVGLIGLVFGAISFVTGMAAGRRSVTAAASSDSRGDLAPDFELKVLQGEGKTLRLSDLRGKAVLLVFWAPWSNPSKTELEFYSATQRQYASSGLQVVAIALDDSSEETIIKFAKRLHASYPILLGTGSVMDHYQVEKLPASIFIDREGHIIARESGLASTATITSNIRKALSEGK